MTKTANKATHTPGLLAFSEGDRDRAAMSLIFKADDKEFLIAYVICDARNEKARAEDIANAEFLVRAWNCHEELLAALRFVSKYFAMQAEKGQPLASQLTGAVAAAIAKAEGGAQ